MHASRLGIVEYTSKWSLVLRLDTKGMLRRHEVHWDEEHWEEVHGTQEVMGQKRCMGHKRSWGRR
eukprot:1142236-Pelagomonas_calceolata.AAC.1